MSIPFFDHPILNSPYEYPTRHWELDESGQPTQKIVNTRREAKFIVPFPTAKKHEAQQTSLLFGDEENLSTERQQYNENAVINAIRGKVDEWRMLPPSEWLVTPETTRLLQHWRHHQFAGIRPFFCQVEAVETLIWLIEVAPRLGKEGQSFLNHIEDVSLDANPELLRIAMKMATGAGKTTVMAMVIAWQTINAVRHPQSRRFTRGFLIVAPGITIRDRLRVLFPNDPDSYYSVRELVPKDMLSDLERAKIVVTNYHAFMLRERMVLSKGGRSLLQGRGEALNTLETEGQMIQRVMPELMSLKNILIINDEAHHCYREKPDKDGLSGDDKDEAEKNNNAARVWITGLEAVKRKIGNLFVLDLSATPFFLRGSGYAEGTLFPWVVSDFSLMDAIESGIVKLPRIPIADNIPQGEMPKFRNLWTHIGPKMPKKGRGKGVILDPLCLPVELQTALDALYGHYNETFKLWVQAGIDTPPCFIIVCNNTASSKLVYDYVSGFIREDENGKQIFINGRLELFRNFDETGIPLGRPRTLLIDSQQLESGDALDKDFRTMAADEIDRFKREMLARGAGRDAVDNLSDQDILREVMNTVGKKERLGGSIRCVVSVAMLTEGWDANTVTHVLGIRAFGTQLLCEQVIGRALRRQSYEINGEGLFDVEYADVLGIPFDFTAKPIVAPPNKPRETVHVNAIPERSAHEIVFPRVQGYRTELPEDRLEAEFTDDSTFCLTPDIVGPTETRNSGIIGESVDLSIKYLEKVRRNTVLYSLTKHLLETKFRDPNGEPKLFLFGQLKKIVSDWMEKHLICKGTFPAQLLYKELADIACERISNAITRASSGENPIMVVLDPYNPTGSTSNVNFTTSKSTRWQTDSQKCHINWAIADSNWELEFCRIVESHPRVISYVKNNGLGFEVPYRIGSVSRIYIPDFILLINDDHEDLLHLIIEIKGYRREDAKDKKLTMETFWIRGVNNIKSYGRWAFAELIDLFDMKEVFEDLIKQVVVSNEEVFTISKRTELFNGKR
ncbi:BPTD_3080 family restriction endonuclease [Sphaerochaeta globosa]|uniref:Type III restriction protein res subunit n=1 Tax=Sphaerochaeta globosa (strain ATCC BAA-1886 / DSM 22777 / Buddy) TaxID=158189 RepID=F0RRD8_SPHGB|nr:DEAD/DEAH box helicase family protein [Sphaerochaeta globosa]ADY14190.1 type III restriction protein res subunit [Sphaerochaeta globosa str. Buddy]